MAVPAWALAGLFFPTSCQLSYPCVCATFSIVVEHVSMSLNNELCRQWTLFFPVGIFFWLDQFPITLPSPSLSQALCEHNRRGGTRGETSGWEGARLLTRAVAELGAWLELN